MNPFDDAATDDDDGDVAAAAQQPAPPNGMSNGKVCARYMFYSL